MEDKAVEWMTQTKEAPGMQIHVETVYKIIH